MVAVIDNPISGRGSGKALSAGVLSELNRRNMQTRLFMTEEEGDGTRQTRMALEAGAELIVCIGGDGTLSEVVSELAGKDIPLIIVPAGTGNDFARAYGLPKEPMEALRRQLDGKRTHIDLGAVNGRPFLNVSGSGFDVDVLRKAKEFRSIYPGEQAYRKAVGAVLGHYRPFEAELSVDGGAWEHVYATIVEIANGRYIGGGMHVAPGARYDDGLLDVIVVGRVWGWSIPLLLPLFIMGIHVHLPIAHVRRAKRAAMRRKDMVVNIDGRLEALDEARFDILPKALCVMKPV